MTQGVRLPLDQIAHETNTRLKLAKKADDHRLAAGIGLVEAKERVQSGEALDKNGRAMTGQHGVGRTSRAASTGISTG